jgi:hypothetical protein
VCTGTVPRKHRPKEGEAKWFEVEKAPGSFQGGEEEVERGAKIRRRQPLHISAKILATIATLMATPRKNVRNYIQSGTRRITRRT